MAMLSTEMHTDRLILRPLKMSDAPDLLLLDSNPEVMRFLGNRPVNSLNEVHIYLQNIMQQYIQNGIGRWAVMEKTSGFFVGWAGMKYIDTTINNHSHFYDVGYRLKPEFWGKGYATECTRLWVNYATDVLHLNTLYAITHVENLASQNVLKKCSFTQKNNFPDIIYGQTVECIWFERMCRQNETQP